MSYCDLLERMMQKDTDAFLEMTDRYGWALYSEIRKKYRNQETADRIYDETMQLLYRSLQNPDCEDPMEAVLCALAETIGRNQIQDGFGIVTDEDIQPPTIQLPQTKADLRTVPRKRKAGFWFKFAMVLVAVGFAAVIWIGVGLLMEAGVLPYYDFGYTWFAAIAANWI
jgi:hypothetical protein